MYALILHTVIKCLILSLSCVSYKFDKKQRKNVIKKTMECWMVPGFYKSERKEIIIHLKHSYILLMIIKMQYIHNNNNYILLAPLV